MAQQPNEKQSQFFSKNSSKSKTPKASEPAQPSIDKVLLNYFLVMESEKLAASIQDASRDADGKLDRDEERRLLLMAAGDFCARIDSLIDRATLAKDYDGSEDLLEEIDPEADDEVSSINKPD